MDKEKVSIIIPVYNREKLLEFCLCSLMKQDYADYEVIVTDDASTDKTAKIAGEFSIKLISLKKNMGAAYARKEGVYRAKGTYLAFIDSDCCAPVDWISKMVKRIKEVPNCTGVNGTYDKDLSNTFISEFAFRINRFKELKTPKFITTCNTSNFMCYRKDFLQVDGFPQIKTLWGKEIRGREDAMLAYMLTKTEKKIVMDSTIVVSQYFRRSWAEFINQQFLFASRLGMHSICYSNYFCDVSSFSRKETCLQIVSLSGVLLFSMIALLTLKAIIIVTGLALFFIISHRRFLLEYRGICLKGKALLALIVTYLTWGSGGIYGLIKGFFLVRKKC